MPQPEVDEPVVEHTDETIDDPDVETLEGAVPEGPQRLYLHIGLPKSGSTYLQSVLGGNRSALKQHGYVYPYVRQEGMFHAAVEVAGRPENWGLSPDEIAGTFAHLLRRGRRLGGTVIISHEIFGAATPDQISAIAAQLEGFDVRVVVTVRNVGRTIAAHWQERVKNGYGESFADYTAELLAGLPEDLEHTEGFWRGQNLAWLLDRWRPVAPPDRTHVVVTPAGSAGPEELWRRFAEAIGIEPDAVDLSAVPNSNESLGTAQIAFLRQVLGSLDGRLQQPWFSRVAKRWFAQSLLSQVRSPKPVTPTPVAERLTGVVKAWIRAVEAGGYRVHGDLTELLPEPAPGGTPHPDDVAPADMLAGLPDVVAEMLLRDRDNRVRIRELEQALEQAQEVQAAGEREREDLARQVEEASYRWWHRFRKPADG